MRALRNVAVCWVFAKYSILSNCTSLKQQLRYYRRRYISHTPTGKCFLFCLVKWPSIDESVYLFTDHCMQSRNSAFFLLDIRCGGKNISGSSSKLNCAAQTISGTGWVRASILSPCRLLDVRSVIRFQNHRRCYSKTHCYPFETF